MTETPGTKIVAPIVNPATGEIVSLDSSTDVLAGYLDAFRQLDAESRRVKTLITDELAQRLDHDARASIEAGDYKITVNSRDAVKYDADLVYALLMRAVERNIISLDAANSACPPVDKRKISKRDLDRVARVLADHDDLHAELKALAVPEARRVTVKRQDA